MRSATPFEQKFPKFLVGDADDRVFVIHLHHPRFVGEVIGQYPAAVRIEPDFIDSTEGISAPEMAALMRQAGDFYISEVS